MARRQNRLSVTRGARDAVLPISIELPWCSVTKHLPISNGYFGKNQKFHLDMDQLKYSLRSVELYIPWARHVYIVTNGQGTDCEIHIPIST